LPGSREEGARIATEGPPLPPRLGIVRRGWPSDQIRRPPAATSVEIRSGVPSSPRRTCSRRPGHASGKGAAFCSGRSLHTSPRCERSGPRAASAAVLPLGSPTVPYGNPVRATGSPREPASRRRRDVALEEPTWVRSRRAPGWVTRLLPAETTGLVSGDGRDKTRARVALRATAEPPTIDSACPEILETARAPRMPQGHPRASFTTAPQLGWLPAAGRPEILRPRPSPPLSPRLLAERRGSLGPDGEPQALRRVLPIIPAAVPDICVRPRQGAGSRRPGTHPARKPGYRSLSLSRSFIAR